MTPLVISVQIPIALDICEINQPEDLYTPFKHLEDDTKQIAETSSHGPTLIWEFEKLPTQEELDELLEEMRVAQERIPNHRGEETETN